MKPTWESECGTVKLWRGDCLDILPTWEDGAVDAVVTDPPYGATSLKWDQFNNEWISRVHSRQIWCFGSLRYWFSSHAVFESLGWNLCQDVIWEKHNGSSFHADRFKRVHEIAVHWYRGKWDDIYKSPPVTKDAKKRTVKRRVKPQHTGDIGESSYETSEGGPKLMRSVLKVRSCHGHAAHPTQKPVDIVSPLICNSVPIDGTSADPFMGSGTTGVAAVRLGRQFWGVELDETYFEIAKRRISEELRARAFIEGKPLPKTQGTLL